MIREATACRSLGLTAYAAAPRGPIAIESAVALAEHHSVARIRFRYSYLGEESEGHLAASRRHDTGINSEVYVASAKTTYPRPADI